jgi:hypothetical protein
MAEFRHIRIHINDPAVQSYIRAGGEVNDLLNDLAKDMRRFSYLYILGGHVRSGRLLDGLNWRHAIDTGPLQAQSRVSSSAKHTRYFMYPTGPIITPHGPYMLVPKYRTAIHHSPATKGAGSELFMAWNAAGRPHKKSFRRRTEVQGYRGHPFLALAKREAFAKRGLWLR